MLDCFVHIPWTVQQALDLKKRKKKKEANLENADAKSKQTLSSFHNIDLELLRKIPIFILFV